jgi:hypothetical protein
MATNSWRKKSATLARATRCKESYSVIWLRSTLASRLETISLDGALR